MIDTSSYKKAFGILASEWKRDTAYQSSTSMIIAHPAYQAIISMGKPAAVLILERLRDGRYDWWFHALHTITGANPSPPEHAGDLAALSKDWIKWGDDNGYLESSDIPLSDTASSVSSDQPAMP